MTAMSYGRARFASNYLQDSLATASPSTLLVMLYDRLVLDLTRAERSLQEGAREAAHRDLMHAQDIVYELMSALDLEVWSGAAGLARLYNWVLRELATANVKGDAARVAAVRTLTVVPLADAWRSAAAEVQAGVVPVAGGSVA